MEGLSITVVTPFGPDVPNSICVLDQEKHEAMQRLAMEVLHIRFPWLAPLLADSDAHILAGIGKFYITLPQDRNRWIEIEELSVFMHLTPWRDEDEIAH